MFTRMGVLDQRRFRADVDPRLHHLAPGHAEILPLQIGAPQSRRLLDRTARVAVVVGHARRGSPESPLSK